MAETPLAVASAVILPDSAEQPPLPPASLKRRQSSNSDDRPKRPRLSHGPTNGSLETMTPSQPATTDRVSERRRSGQMEERKRGQRLFGALLGTLSQSSSSTAQKRRTDIENKQQAKLKLQAEEQDEKKKQKLEILMAMRRREQRKYDKQSMQIRHSNMLAQAHFLQTKTEPKLYYEPWKLLPGDDENIKTQVEKAEAIIQKEIFTWDAENKPLGEEAPPDTKTQPPEKEENDAGTAETVGSVTYKEQLSSPKPPDSANPNGTVMPDVEERPAESLETMKDQGDDGGEVVEGEEDTVIY